MKKTIVSIALLVLLAIPLTACAPAGSTSSARALPADNSGDSSSGLVQSGLPLRVTEPADGATINGGTVTVKGQTAPGATVTVNEQADVADGNGNFSITIRLDEGLNTIDVIATDDSGNEGDILLMVNVVTGP